MPTSEREWEHPDAPARRTGNMWLTEEYEALIQAAHEARPLQEIADTLRRNPSAITARARRILPEDWSRVGSSWWEDLCVLFATNRNYDWAAALTAQGDPPVSYATIKEIETLPRYSEEALRKVVEITGLNSDRAHSLLRRHGWEGDGATLKVRNLLTTTAHLPLRAHPGDAGLDLRYAGDAPITLTPAHQSLIPTGVAVAVPQGHVGLICPRSGLAAKHGVTVVNAPGVIDHGYTGEIKVCLGIVGTENEHTIHPGERIAQLVLTPIIAPEIELVDSLEDSERGEGGFGHTGKA